MSPSGIWVANTGKRAGGLASVLPLGSSEGLVFGNGMVRHKRQPLSHLVDWTINLNFDFDISDPLPLGIASFPVFSRHYREDDGPNLEREAIRCNGLAINPSREDE